MLAIDYRRDVQVVGRSASVRDAARRMRAVGVGSLVVMQSSKAVGILTDRDLLTRVIARGLDGSRTAVGDVMSAPLVSVSPRDSLDQVIAAMVQRGIRRVPVLCGGRPTGIVALDDLVVASSAELSDVVRGIQRGSPCRGQLAASARARQQLESQLERLDAEIERLGGGARDSLLRRLETLRQHLRSDAP
jgi:signal-transduction protein with cAMP-binding, CBS, and nucleotidyltransferase domain